MKTGQGFPYFTKSKTRLFFFSVFFIFFTFSCFGQFREKYKGSDVDNDITGIHFVSPSIGFVAFDKFIGYTSDSGKTFTKRYIGNNNTNFNGNRVNLTLGFFPLGVHAFSKDSLLVHGHYFFEPSILFSSDQGQSWKVVFHRNINLDAHVKNEGITDIEFPSSGKIGYAVHHEQILKTNDKGQNWFAIANRPNEQLSQLSFPSLTTGFAVGKSSVYKTVNGQSWHALYPPPHIDTERDYNNVFFLNTTTGYITEKYTNRIYRTTDGGTRWQQMNDENLFPIRGTSLHFSNDSTGFIAGNGIDVIKTTDYGKTWEACKDITTDRSRNYGLNTLFFYNDHIGWSGGDFEYLLINTDGGKTTIPKAVFTIDTAGVGQTGMVKMVNHSKKAYSYKWYKNGVMFSTAYNASYQHDIYRTVDTIKLVVSNGVDADTIIQYQYFNPPVVITSFTPTIGEEGTIVAISGMNFSDATSVLFGGTPASSFTVISSKLINAVVGEGSSGSIVVTTLLGSGARAGFTYTPSPLIDLPVSISDSLLCKSESVIVTIRNTEPNVRYELIDSLGNSFGFINSTGGTTSFKSLAITRTANYKIKVTRTNSTLSKTFTDKLFIRVEHTKSSFIANKINIGIEERIDYYERSQEAQSFIWKFGQDANVSSSNLANPQDIYYRSSGEKTLSLISISQNGCSDTLTSNGVFVYGKPVPDDVCYAQNVEDYGSPTSLNGVTKCLDNGYLISGFGNRPLIKSRYGTSKNLPYDGVAYIAKYTTDGIINWVSFIKNKGEIKGSATDKNGNIYIIGCSYVHAYFHFNNGDSIKLAATPDDTLSYSSKYNGFILKLDSNGKYLWHTTIDDPAEEFQGYLVHGGIPTKIKIEESHIIIAGDFFRNLGYCRNGVKQKFVGLSHSSQNNFIFKINDDGSLQWHMYFENTTVNPYYKLSDIDIDDKGNVYATGYYENELRVHDVGNKTNFTYSGIIAGTSSYLFKFNSFGHLVWKVNMRNNFSFQKIMINAIATDDDGNSYITGSSTLYDKTQYLEITSGNGNTTKASLASYCLMKFDTNGIYKWGVGSQYSYYGQGNAVYIKGKDLYTVGNIAKDEESLTAATLTSTNGNNVIKHLHESEFFVANYDTAGVLKRVARSGENVGGHVVVNNLVIDDKNNFIVSGMTDNWNGGNNTFKIFNSSISTNSIDGFFAKLNFDFCLSSVSLTANAGVDKVRCAGDTATIGTPAIGNSYTWTSYPKGFSSSHPNPIVTPLITTSYFLTVSNSTGETARDTVLITVIPSPFAGAGDDKEICVGSNTGIGVGALNGNIYGWSSNPEGFSSTAANPIVSPLVTTNYYLTVTNAAGCKSKDTVVVTVNKTLLPSVSIASPETTICPGTSVTFTATPTNGGTNPVYQWQVNGVNAGVDSSSFTTNRLKDKDQVKVIITSNAGCASTSTAISNIITMAVNPTSKPIGKAVSPTQACSSDSFLVSFTSSNTPNGSNVQIWESINGTAFTSGSIQSFNASALNFQIATKGNEGVSKYFFTITPPATNTCFIKSNSDTVSIQVDHLKVPVTTLNNQILTVTNPDPNALYTWQILQNSSAWQDIVPAATGINYQVSVDGSYRVKSTKGACSEFSNSQILDVAAIIRNGGDALGIYLYPNPTTDILTIDSLKPSDNWVTLDIMSIDGSTKFATVNVENKTKVTVRLERLSKGMYLAILTTRRGSANTIKFMKL